MFDDIKKLQEYIHVSGLLDIQLLKPYIKIALRRKIYPLVPPSLLAVLQAEGSEIYEGLQSAVAHYTLACAVPFIKVHISNTGVNHFQDDKMQKASWWDIRDYALSSVKIADDALSRSIDLLLKSDKCKQLHFLNPYKPLIFRSPAEFQEVYPIGSSWEVFLNLLPMVEDAWRSKIKSRIKHCSLKIIKQEAGLFFFIKKAAGFYAVCDAIDSSLFVFTRQGLAIQWEELPWQRSQILSQEALVRMQESLKKKAYYFVDEAIKYLRANREKFPCYQVAQEGDEDRVVREVISKKSGLYF